MEQKEIDRLLEDATDEQFLILMAEVQRNKDQYANVTIFVYLAGLAALVLVLIWLFTA